MYHANLFELARLSSKHENIDCILHRKYIFMQLLNLYFINTQETLSSEVLIQAMISKDLQ